MGDFIDRGGESLHSEPRTVAYWKGQDLTRQIMWLAATSTQEQFGAGLVDFWGTPEGQGGPGPADGNETAEFAQTMRELGEADHNISPLDEYGDQLVAVANDQIVDKAVERGELDEALAEITEEPKHNSGFWKSFLENVGAYRNTR